MRSRSAVALAALAVLAVALTVARSGSGTKAASSPSARPSAASPRPPLAPAPAEARPGTLRRDVFRFADGREAGEDADLAPAEAALRRGAGETASPTPEARPRLVGLLSRGGRVLAALVAEDGEVELAGPGETAAGVMVVEIGDDSVRVKRPDGTEVAIPLP
jgi:hypothetical protein